MTEVVGDFCYNKKDLIGHGAFAVVFKGQHTKKEDFVVAIKVISKKNLSKTQSLLAKEIKILKELHHENVVALYDCQERPNNVYLVMEYCNGGDLADYLQAKGTLSEDTIRIFLKQIASAMGALQSKGIVHRDLKPQNLLLSHTGITNPPPSDIKIKIADFGFARFLPGEMMAATLCGSPMYMAPEVIMSKAYDAKADLWSLGTIVYQCLTGKAPFTANSPQALKKFYEKNKGICPNIPAGTSTHIKDLLTGLLKRNPKDRMDFGDFFSHPFLTGRIVQRSSTPVAVPSRHRNYSGCSQGTKSSSSSSPSFGAEALGDIRVDLLHRMTPPFDITDTSPQDPHPVSQGSLEHSPGNAYYHRGQRLSGVLMPSPPRPLQADDDLEPEDFVIVPNSLDTTDGAPKAKGPWDLYFPYECQSSPPRTVNTKMFGPGSPRQMSPRSPPRRATFIVGSSSPTSPPTRPRTYSASNQPSLPRSTSQQASVPVPQRVRTNSSPGPRPHISPTSQSPTPIPVPRKTSTPVSPTEPLAVQQTQTQGAARKISLPKGSIPGDVPRTLPSPSCVKTAGAPSDTVSPSLVTAVAKTLTDNSKGGLYNLANLNAVPAISAEPTSMEPLGRTTPGTIRRAMSNIERTRNPSSSSSLLSALARQTNAGLMPLETLSEGTEARPILKVHSSPAILATAMGLSRNRSFGLLNTGQFHLGLNTNQAPRRHSSGAPLSPQSDDEPVPPTSTIAPYLPPIPGSPTKSLHTSHGEEEKGLKPLRGLFTAGSSPPSATMMTEGIIPFHSLPKYSGQEPAVVSNTPALVTPGKGTKVTRGFSETSSSVSHEVEPCSPEMEGPIALVAPELPEDTLLETEHTDGVRKLSFALSLVDAILVVIRARGTPLSTLADSMALRMNESVLTDQIGNISEECRTTEQLVLYMKALRISSLALRFAQDELKERRLKPSNAVKNVVNDLNDRYRQCLNRTSKIKSSLQTKAMTMDKIITANANKLMYMYAMELCQNAALDELFGNPKECREKYETAQLLLQGLEEDVKKDADLFLLQKYKTSVDRRLAQLSRRKTTSINVR